MSSPLLRRWTMMQRNSPLWLSKDAQTAIVAALGWTDGLTLIQNTQTYLDGLYVDGQGMFAHQLADFCNKYPLFARLMLMEYSLQRGGTSLITYEVPKMPEDLDLSSPLQPSQDDQRLWLRRKGYNYSGWDNPVNIVSHTDWILRQSGFGNGSWYNIIGTWFTKNGITIGSNTYTIYHTFVRFFIPTALPTGYKTVNTKGTIISINGKRFTLPITTAITTTPYDFSNIIKLNDVNYVAITESEGGDAWIGFGFY